MGSKFSKKRTDVLVTDDAQDNSGTEVYEFEVISVSNRNPEAFCSDIIWISKTVSKEKAIESIKEIYGNNCIIKQT